MQILIDIPEEDFRALKDRHDDDCLFIHKAVKNGTPLPKNHGKLKDADMLITELKKRHDFFVNKYGSFNSMLIQDKARADEIRVIKGMVINAPTIIEADKAEQEE